MNGMALGYNIHGHNLAGVGGGDSKQCQIFKKYAQKFEDALKLGIEDLEVVINPEKVHGLPLLPCISY